MTTRNLEGPSAPYPSDPWPDLDTRARSRLIGHLLRVEPQLAHPKMTRVMQPGDLFPTYVHVRDWRHVPPSTAPVQRESVTYVYEGVIDNTAPGAIETCATAAPGPAINIYPRRQRGLRGWLRRRGGRT